MTLASNTITAAFTGEMQCIKTEPRYQYDYGQRLVYTGVTLPSAYQVYFSNDVIESAKTRIGDETGVEVPDEYFLSGDPVFAWLFLHDGADDGRTVYKVVIPVIQRPDPEHEEPSPEQSSEINQAIAALNDAVTRTNTSATDAENSAVKAESYAVGGTGTRVNEDVDNAKFYSEVAEQAASVSGWVEFYIDEDGYLHYRKTPNSTLEFYVDNRGYLHVRG